MEVNMIVARGADGAIGKEGNLIWHLPGDLKRFKDLTMGHPVIMGRKTWESLPKRPLPGRRNIVLTRQKDWSEAGAERVNTLEEALSLTSEDSPFIIGGAEIYNAFMPYTTCLFLTEVDAVTPDADAFLNLDLSSWEILEESPEMINDNNVRFRYKVLKKKS